MSGISAIYELIPHREPFLFVDEVVEVGERSVCARKYIDPSWEVFRGHYPGEPIMPGVLLCECCFQAGALLMANRGDSPGIARPVLTRIQDARFKRIVRPGETLDIEVSLDDEVDNAFYMTGRASVAGEMAVRVSFACMAAANGG
jgi:3-hydroxyacyl-[acyl-carrier-protein] dehydratase